MICTIKKQKIAHTNAHKSHRKKVILEKIDDILCKYIMIYIYIIYMVHLQVHFMELQYKIYAGFEKIGVMPLPGGSLMHET